MSNKENHNTQSKNKQLTTSKDLLHSSGKSESVRQFSAVHRDSPVSPITSIYGEGNYEGDIDHSI